MLQTLQHQNRSLKTKILTIESSLAQALSFARKLLQYYRKMQAVLNKYRGEKHRLVHTVTSFNPAFMVDMDVYLETDSRKLRERLEDAWRSLTTATEDQRAGRQRKVDLLERELEKYQCILDEIRVHSMLADEAIVVSEIHNLDPDDRLVQQLLVEHPEYADARQDNIMQASPAEETTAEAQHEPSIARWDWPFYILLAAVVLFAYSCVVQQVQKGKWAAANNFSRALWVNDENGDVPFTWVQLALTIIMIFQALNKGT
jgi:hypothetical protein